MEMSNGCVKQPKIPFISKLSSLYWNKLIYRALYCVINQETCNQYNILAYETSYIQFSVKEKIPLQKEQRIRKSLYYEIIRTPIGSKLFTLFTSNWEEKYISSAGYIKPSLLFSPRKRITLSENNAALFIMIDLILCTSKPSLLNFYMKKTTRVEFVR